MFVKLELSILETNLQRLSGADFRALIAMSKYVDNTGRCFPSVPRIADDIGVKRRMVQRSMRRLEEVGLIKTEMVGGGRYRPNKYRLLHFTFGKNENSDKSDAVMGEKGDSLDAVTEQRNSDKNRQKGDKIGRNSDNLVPETASNLSPELEPLTRAKELEPLTRAKALISQLPIAVRAFLEGYDIEIEGHALESLHSWCNRLPVETILEALKEGVEHDAYSWSYIESILRRKERERR